MISPRSVPAFSDAPRGDRTAARAALRGHYEAHGRDLDLREAFVRDPRRGRNFSLDAPEVHADLSKNLIDIATRRQELDRAGEGRLEPPRGGRLERLRP